MPENWLVTGGSGFIGTEVVKSAIARGHRVLNVDIKQPRLPEQRKFWSKTDIRSADRFVEVVKGFAPDRILHLASNVEISLSSLSQYTTTIDGTLNILDAAHQVPNLKGFLHTSTQYVVKPGVEPKDDHHLDPYTPYGEAKAEAERVVWASGLLVPWMIVRPTIIWGPHHPSLGNQIFKYISNRMYLHPSGPEPIMRVYGYVTNTAEQMVRLTEQPPSNTNRKIFYLGDASIDYDVWADAFSIGLTGKPARRVPLSVLRLVGRAGDACKKLGFSAAIDTGRVFRMSTPSKIDLKATHAITGSPAVGFDQGVEETLKWLKSLQRGLNSSRAEKMS